MPRSLLCWRQSKLQRRMTRFVLSIDSPPQKNIDSLYLEYSTTIQKDAE